MFAPSLHIHLKRTSMCGINVVVPPFVPPTPLPTGAQKKPALGEG